MTPQNEQQASDLQGEQRNDSRNDGHLPECFWPDVPERAVCICDRLRACEQRVFQEQIEGRQHDMVMAYLRGIDVARDAVATVSVRKDTSHDMRVQALAAIDALQGEQQ